ncbi:hypothetical protein C7H19_16020 [Aphanothece hegewaldii CCALA 016]|uniref:Filamentous haemagglutinin FhaB/tRNA nuclease CdiA-like TPS domain-containing protein n=1 Tax=Aphanothece hegewaldii CCALA 016 TaxID=2107694 RepID=A0A2T1LV06_9CHRO|nr:filamentous hemagglutinin N-terminal domain-containing protein [Aphanothece hegewaldii]PSF35520.1 hypothetical protein C7H19_16020 [Aphanothece hegewaldii CCALA 016]
MKRKINVYYLNTLVLTNLLLLTESLFSAITQAQVTPDTTLGKENSIVNQIDVLNDKIDGGARRGGNLFHSFQEFNINEGKGVYFANPSGVMNIFSRVTGGNASQILGRLGVLGQSNLFFLNPYGIIFGPNSSLDIRGSFVSSTADAVKFADGTEFSSINPQNNALLTISVPVGLQTGNHPATINIQNARLSVDLNQTLAIIGGNLTLNGAQLNTGGGQIILGGLSETGLIGLNFINNIPIFSFPTGVARADILIDNGTVVDIKGVNGGTIEINAHNLDITGKSEIRAGIGSGIGSVSIQAGNIDITATQGIKLTNFSQISSSVDSEAVGRGGEIILSSPFISLTNSFIRATTNGQGNSGGIKITTGSLFLNDGAQILASTQRKGNTGAIKITANDTISLSGNDSQGSPSSIISQVAQKAQGNSEGIEIITGSLFLNNGAKVDASTSGIGNAGAIKITANETISLNGERMSPKVSSTAAGNSDDSEDIISLGSRISSTVSSTAVGNSDEIQITTGSLFLTNGGQVNATTYGQGNAGAIKITARDTIYMAGRESQNLASAIRNIVARKAVGNSNEIQITTGSLFLTDRVIITSQTRGKGTAGNITITANTLTSKGDSIIRSDTQTSFNAGDLTLNISDILTLSNSSLIAITRGEGTAGDITINVPQLNITESANILARTYALGQGGSITVNAPISVILGENSQLNVISSSAGRAGNIKITSNTVTIGKGAKISATSDENATNSEAGGSITINASNLYLSGTLGIFAETKGQAPAGNLTFKPNGNQSNLNIQFTDKAEISARTTSQKRGGSINISSPETINIAGQGKITVETIGSGRAGNINITTEQLNIGNQTEITASTRGSGQAGNIIINTPQFTLAQRAIIQASTSSSGNGGSITVNAPISVILGENSQLNVETSGQGKAGNINITSNTVTIGKNAQISATATQSATNTESGSISINASNLNIAGQLGIFAETTGLAPAGTLTLNPISSNPNLIIRFIEQGKISASTTASGIGGDINISAPNNIDISGNGTIATETSGTGNAGTINLSANQLHLNQGVRISASTTGRGNAGNINLNANQINLQQSTITAFTNGTGNAGNITLNIQNTLTSNNSTISTSANQASGGIITISAQDIRLQGDSDIRTNVSSGAGGGGDITLTADSILAFNDSDILAFAQDGIGGNITLNTPIFFGNGYSPTDQINQNFDNLDNNNRVDINASGAVSGVISVPNLTFIQNSLFEFPETLINTDNLLASSCVVPNQQKAGTFILTGPDGLPSSPNDNFTSPYPTGTIETIPKPSLPSKIDEPQGFYRLNDGKIVLSTKCN